MTMVARVLPWTTIQSICWSQPWSGPDNTRLPCAAPIKTHAIIWQPWLDTKNKQKGRWHKENERRRRRHKDRNTMVHCDCWKAKVIKWCVVYFDHPLGLCLVFCIVLPRTLLTALLLLSSALEQNPFSGMESRRWFCADQCSDEVQGLGLLCPSLLLCDRASKPFSPGRECEVWESPALSVRSSPLRFKLLQMCGESGHRAGSGWDGWLTGCRVLNLPFTNTMMNVYCLLPVSLQSYLRVNHNTVNSDSRSLPDISKLIWKEFGCEHIWALWVFVLYKAGSQTPYHPDVFFLGPCPSAFQKERRVQWRMLFLLSHISLKITHEWLSAF